MTFADLPPSSSVTRLIVPAAPCMTSRPTSVEPVNAIFATSGCSISRCPTTEPLPTSTLTTPSGIPASRTSSPSRIAESGVSSAGLRTTVFAARERRPELPARDVRREVPGDDQPDDAERLAKRRRDTACDGDRLAAVLVDRAGVEVEDLRDHADLAARAGDRLADVLRLDPRELLGVLLDERREPPEKARTVGGRDRPPCGKRRLRSCDRCVRLLDAGLLELGDRLLRRRVDDRQRHGLDSNTALEAAAPPHPPDAVDDPREHGDEQEREDPERLAHARERRRRLSEDVRDEDDGQSDVDEQRTRSTRLPPVGERAESLLRARRAVLASLLDERLEERGVLARLRVPLDADGEAQRRVLDGLERAVGGPRGLDEPVADPSERLVVMRRHLGACDPTIAPSREPSFTSTGCTANSPGTCL